MQTTTNDLLEEDDQIWEEKRIRAWSENWMEEQGLVRCIRTENVQQALM